MKTVKKILWTLSVIMVFFAGPAYAQNNNTISRENVDSVVTNKNVSSDRASITKMPRGRILSSATLQISDEGNGTLGVYADTLCHISVKKIDLIIYLDIWNEANEDWEYVNSYEYTWLSSDYPDQSLNMAVVSFDIEGLNRGREYRLRAVHGARSFDSMTEIMSTRTDGIVLD